VRPCLVAPNLVKTLIPAAIPPVELIAYRVLLVLVLVIVFGLVELGSRDNLRIDGASESLLLLDGLH
jgi:hypothetical protein